jgi:hypothetical protein
VKPTRNTSRHQRRHANPPARRVSPKKKQRSKQGKGFEKIDGKDVPIKKSSIQIKHFEGGDQKQAGSD